MSGMMSLLHVHSRLILAYLVLGISISTILVTAGILMLTALVIYVVHHYRRTRVHVRVRTIVFLDSSNVPQNTEECCICLCNYVIGDQLASL